jgi:hypothetical protein
MLDGVRPLGVLAGRFEDDIGAQFLPGELADLFFRQDLDLLSVDDDGVAVDKDFALETAQNGVVFQEVGQRLGVGDVVRRDDLDGRIAGRGRSCADAADPLIPIPMPMITSRMCWLMESLFKVTC